MGLGNQRRTAGQDEVFQRPQFFIPHIDRRFQALDFRRIQRLIHRHCQLTAQIKQSMLAGRQNLDHFLQAGKSVRLCRQPGQQHAHLTVECIDFANGLDPRVILGDATAIAQPGLAFVASAGVNLRQTKAHGYLDSRLSSCATGGVLARGRRKVKQVPWPRVDCTSICPLWLLVMMKYDTDSPSPVP
ncbi:hypothetical protein D3C75_408710 [compost metagenome]